MASFLVFPTMLFEDVALLKKGRYRHIYLIEDPLYFTTSQHKIKVALHRATMRAYGDWLRTQFPGKDVIQYIEFMKVDDFINKGNTIGKVETYEMIDRPLTDRWKGARLTFHPTQMFLHSVDKLGEFHARCKSGCTHDAFFKWSKQVLKVMEDVPSTDRENRVNLKDPNFVEPVPPKLTCVYHDEAWLYVERHFAGNIGDSRVGFDILPVTFEQAHANFTWFLTEKFRHFGKYQDAIRSEAVHMYHSNISASLNIGLLTPTHIVTQIMASPSVPMNSREALLRQVVGWREYMRYIYNFHYDTLKGGNLWENKKKIRWGSAFYTGTTGIQPLDTEIRKAISWGYSHHIVRLMIFLNFMVLAEVCKEDVYTWMMAMFIDAYDWVMVSCIGTFGFYVHGFTHKPYLASVNYIRRMSNYGGGPWEYTWQTIFYTFLTKKKNVIGQSKARVYLRNLAYFEKLEPAARDGMIKHATQSLKKITS